MKRFISVILILAMVLALLPAMPAFAVGETATMEMSGVRIEYPTCLATANQNSSAFQDSLKPNVEITYEKSSERVQWLEMTMTESYLGWRDGAMTAYASAAGAYIAYKIRVPKAGGYNVTVQYRKTKELCKSEMYILPISAKDNIKTEIAKEDTAKASVEFATEDRPAYNSPFTSLEPFYWEAESAGEYIIVWKATEVASANSKVRMNPANIIFDGCGEEKADALVGKIMLSDTELITGESAVITPVIYNGFDGKAVTENITYTCDSDVLSIDGTTVTAKKPGKGILYAEVAGYPNKVELEVNVTAANMSGVRAQYPTYQALYGDAETIMPNDITYALSGQRIDWYDYTGTYGVTEPNWNGTVARFMLRQNEYAAYKINVPAKGFYNVTLEYKVADGGTIADMYLLPGDTPKEDIKDAVNASTPFIKDLHFLYSDHNGASAGDILKLETSFDAKAAGEYLVVWMSKGAGSVRPKNLILDGSNGQEKNGIVGKIELDDSELVAGESTTLATTLNDAYTGALVTGTVISSDTGILSVEGTTVTANKAGTATLYAEVAGYPNKVALEVNVAAANAPVELTEKVNFASGAAIEYKIGDGEYTSLSANNVKSIPVGTEITVKANDGDNFAGWVRGTEDSENWISDESEYTFTIMSHTYLTPVYTETEKTDAEQVVEFWNENKEYLGSADVVEGKATAPVATLTGHNFIAWHISETDILPLENGSVHVSGIADAIIRAVAKHSAENGFGTKVTNSNASATYWKRGEDIVAYGSFYDFYQWNGAANITYGIDAVENKPLVVLDSTSVDGAYMIEYDKGNATEIVEAGILFGSDDDIVIGSTDGSKAVSQRKDNHGQFCAKPNANGASDYARGYLIYRGTDNKLYVIYTNAIEINQ